MSLKPVSTVHHPLYFDNISNYSINVTSLPINRGNCISRKIWVNGPFNFSRKLSCFNSKSKTSYKRASWPPSLNPWSTVLNTLSLDFPWRCMWIHLMEVVLWLVKLTLVSASSWGEEWLQAPICILQQAGLGVTLKCIGLGGKTARYRGQCYTSLCPTPNRAYRPSK